MDIAYFDSSALVKLVVLEDGSDIASELRERSDEVMSSELAYVEVRAALAAAHRDRRLSSRQFSGTKDRWERIWRTVSVIAATSAVMLQAGDLAEDLALRGYDAVHLASALALGSSAMVVASWDGRMRSAARAIGFATAPAVDG